MVYELTKAEERQLLENSVERMINTTITIGEHGEDLFSSDYLKELSSINWQDWKELKPLVVKLWNAAAEELRRKRYSEAK